MNADAITGLSLSEVARAIADGGVSAVAATQACLDALEGRGHALNAVAGMDREAALEAAEAADAARARGEKRGEKRGDALGPLHGVPLAHKDMFYRAGRPSACGSRIRADFKPARTAHVLARLDAAGALDIARLNMVEFALGTTGHNDFTGPVRNPWNPAHISGGSSSGPGAAVAARCVFGALGSDTGGSIRIPAACCGVVGVKPTYGLVSRRDAMPLSFTLDTIGPLARTVEDAALLLKVIAGHDPKDPTSSPRPIPDYVAGIEEPVANLRIAVPVNWFYDPVTDAVRRAMDASLEVFKGLGAEIVPVTIPSVEIANRLTTLIIATEGAALHRRWLAERPDDYGKQTLARLLPGLHIPATAYIDALRLRAGLFEAFTSAVFAKADVLHLPVLPFEVPRIDDSDIDANPDYTEFIVLTGHCTRPINLLGLPAVSVPAGRTPNGLPTAFQLVGRPFDEATLLRVARMYERAAQTTAATPPIAA